MSTYPTTEEYVAELVKGVADMNTLPGGNLVPPLQTQVQALTATIEGASGMPIGQIGSLATDIAALTQATNPLAISAAVEGVISNSLDTMESIMDATGIASDAISVVPVVGQAVAAVFMIIEGILSQQAAKEAQLKQCRDQLAKDLDAFCQQLKEDSEPRATDIDPVSGEVVTGPGDYFRPLAMKYRAGSNELPANASAVLLALCGGVAGNGEFGITEEDFQEVVELFETGQSGMLYSGFPPSPVGFDMTVRIRMWGLIKGLMASVQDPFAEHVTRHADNGRSLMPLLLGLVNEQRWQHFGEGQEAEEKFHAFLEALARKALGWTRRVERCFYKNSPFEAGGLESHGGAGKFEPPYNSDHFGWVRDGCSPRLRKGMADQTFSILDKFNVQLSARFFDHATGQWQATFAGGVAASVLAEAFDKEMFAAIKSNLPAAKTIFSSVDQQRGFRAVAQTQSSRVKKSRGGAGPLLIAGGLAALLFARK